jgi:hypothetical protein
LLVLLQEYITMHGPMNVKKIKTHLFWRVWTLHIHLHNPTNATLELNWAICYFVHKKNFYTRKSQLHPERDAVKQSLSHTTYTILWKNTHSLY